MEEKNTEAIASWNTHLDMLGCKQRINTVKGANLVIVTNPTVLR